MSGDGSNAAKGRLGAGYTKAMQSPFYGELYNAAPAAQPDIPTPGYNSSPLTDPARNEPPPAPDRYLRGLSTCASCGGTFGFNGVTDAQVCPSCSDAQRITGGLTAPGTPWFG